jgi:hypothetical protein
MSLYNTVTAAAGHFAGRLLRRALLAFLMVVFALVALYHFTSAGTVALEQQYGTLYAQLIVGAIYIALTLISLMILWIMGRKHTTAAAPAVAPASAEMQMAMLVEAGMLGYSMGKKKERAS